MANDTQRLLDHLDERLARLEELTAVGSGRLDDQVVERAEHALSAAKERLGHGTSHTVVALAGATGSGKSSLFNAIAGLDLAQTGVTRPTTATAQAVVYGDGAARILDWLQVPKRHELADPTLAGLVLLDLPDHDSTVDAHRSEVDRLVAVVDVFVWVVDPQKYADAALHEEYLQRFARHSSVTVVALNQIDRLTPEERRQCIEDLHRLLAEDGLSDVRVLATSTITGEGVSSLRNELAARVAERRALISRLEADLDWIADDLVAACGDVTPGSLQKSHVRALHAAFAEAAGVDGVAQAVGSAYRLRASQSLGWPPIRWVRNLRPDPLRRMGLDRHRDVDEFRSQAPELHRTSRPGPSVVAEAGVANAVANITRTSTEGLPEPLRRRTVAAATPDPAQVADQLDRAVAHVKLPTRPPRSWPIINAVQWVLTAVMVLGLVWLAARGVVAWFGLPDLPSPKISGRLSWPTALAIGGALAGLAVAALGRVVANLGAKRRASQARRELMDASDEVADRMVTEPLRRELDAVGELGQLARRFAR